MTKIIPASYFHKQQHKGMNLNKAPLTKANLCKKVTDIEIYAYYTGEEININGARPSPFREDRNPSFGYFIGTSGEICWKDFVIGTGDCIAFVKQLFGLNFNEALIKIVKDFNVEDEFDFKDTTVPLTDGTKKTFDRANVVKKLAKDKIISIKRRKAQMHDVQFWLSFGITKQTLIKYNVTPIEYYFINGNIIKTDKYAYAFIEYKDNKETYKIYQPFNEHYKWINNHNESTWQGWSQLPAKGETLIITKSLKDVMSIWEVLKIPAIALQSEQVNPKKHVMEQLIHRFDDVYLFYDNDFDKEVNWGREAAQKLHAAYPSLYRVDIQERHKAKDFSDLVKEHGAIKANSLWFDEICVPY